MKKHAEVGAAKLHVHQLTQHVDATFKRADRLRTVVSPLDETHADYAKYLCVVLSGYLEVAISILLNARLQLGLDDEKAKRYFKATFTEFRNPEPNRILDLLDKCDNSWRLTTTKYLEHDGRGLAVESVVSLRNQIAHGGNPSYATFSNVDSYRPKIKDVVSFIESLVIA